MKVYSSKDKLGRLILLLVDSKEDYMTAVMSKKNIKKKNIGYIVKRLTEKVDLDGSLVNELNLFGFINIRANKNITY